MHPRSELRRDVQSRGRHRGSFCPAHSAPPRQGLEQGAGVCVGGCLTAVSPHVFSVLLPGLGEQLGGACLLGIGIWVMVDPTGFREIVAANPLLITGAYILLAMGGLLFLLGFLGCCGAVRENKCLLLFVSIPWVPWGGGWIEPCTHTKGDSHWGLSQVGWPPGAGEPPTLAIRIHAGPVPAAWVSRPQARGGLGLQVRTARLPHRRVS